MKPNRIFPFLCLAASCLAHADVLIDFGMNGTTPAGHPDQRTAGTSPTWNNLAIGPQNIGGSLNAGAPVFIAVSGGLPTLSTVALSDTAGTPSGYSISFSSTGSKSGALGTAGTGGDYNGTVAPLAITAFPATSATRDSLFVNSATGANVAFTVTLSGLDNAARYDLTVFGGRNTPVNGGRWALTTGTATTARFQTSDGTIAGNTGESITNGGTHKGIVIQWLQVAPSGGNISFRLTPDATGIMDLNALRLSPAAPAGEADVYLLGGQSNMQGLGKLNELTPQQLAPPADVFYWNGSSFQALVPGTTLTAGSATDFGPEIAFASQVAKRGRKAYIIKYPNSGKPLDSGWSDQVFAGDPPAPNRVNFYPGLTSSDPNQGTLYKNAMLPRFQTAIQSIAAQGYTPVIRGLIWMQGEQDSKNAISAGRYAANLKRLRDRLADDLGMQSATDLPLVFGQVLPFEPAEPRFTHRTEIRAEMALADQDSGSPKAIPQCRMVSTDGYPVYPSPDAVHYTTPGQIALGSAFADALARLTARPIHLSFHNLTATADAMAPSIAPTAQGAVVNTTPAHWNKLVNAAAHTFSAVALDSSDGSSSGAAAAGNTGYTGSNGNGWATANKDSVMMDGWYGFGGTESLTIHNLPGDLAQGYHVVVYGDSNDVNRTMNYTLGGVTRTIQDRSTFNGTFAPGANHVVFSGLTGGSFVITGNAAGSPRSAVNGISIVPGAPLAIDSFTASDQYVNAGETVALNWSVTGADSVAISPGIGSVTGNSVNVVVQETTTFVLTASSDGRTISRDLKVSVGPARPNIVMFLVDDMGWQDTSVPFQHDANGNPVVTGFNQRYRTPHMEALAASGMKFTNAYTPSVCSPSRTSLMTGMSACRHRVTQWTLVPNTDQSGVSPNLKSPLDWNINGLAPASDTSTPRTWRTDATLPKLLQQAGYRTIHVGKAHFGADGLPGEEPGNLGFDVNIAGHAAGGPSSYLGTANYASTDARFNVPGLEAYHGTSTFLTEALTLEGNKAMEQAVEDGRPFYLYMSHYAIHVPLAEDARFAANYPGLDATERKYATMIEGMDKSLGDIRAKLNQLGVAENTLILFYSDNGGLTYGARGTTPSGTGANTHNKPLRSGKGSAYEGGTRIPAIASWAAVNSANAFQQQLPVAPASRCDKPVIIEDIYPTLLEVARLPTPEAIDGISFTGYLKNDPAFTRPVSLLFHYPHVWVESLIGLNQGYEMHSSLREGDWKVIHYYEGSRWELYNLANDLGEADNLAASRPDLVFQLGRRMIRLLEDRGARYPANRTTNLSQGPLLPNNATVDSDNDGRSDIQEDPNRNGLIDAGETNPDDNDSDGDGTPDGAEARLGTNPLDSSSAFRVVTSMPSAGVLRLTWPSMPGNSFAIRNSRDLSDWSTVVVENLPAAAEPARSTSHQVGLTTDPQGYFRVLLEEAGSQAE